MLRKISFWYTLAFIVLWNGYAVQQYFTGQPGAVQLFFFGIGFTVILLGATWFSRWLMKHYKVVDEKADEILSTKFKKDRRHRNGKTVY
ncbi:hypothetical protein HNR44_003467 [Geomicrobium halophilum]|uniref:Uncharacterized protein n=1 Tax=Geomicrobium halophilum TaxID=549000 RepID=A0A841PW21_9BACL|nr:hypothetical protein [Geomicrobium halophilum]MBB6451456.1 hypothetical protein [Geomicrobium halophilum]